MKPRLLILAGFFVVCLGAPCRVKAQAIGEILGTVRDPSGAVLPRAKITAIQTATGLTRSTTSDAEGTYTLPQLPVGSYEVTVEAPGFKTATSTGITLDVSQQRQVDFTLALASAQQQVEVTANPSFNDNHERVARRPGYRTAGAVPAAQRSRHYQPGDDAARHEPRD